MRLMWLLALGLLCLLLAGCPKDEETPDNVTNDQAGMKKPDYGGGDTSAPAAGDTSAPAGDTAAGDGTTPPAAGDGTTPPAGGDAGGGTTPPAGGGETPPAGGGK